MEKTISKKGYTKGSKGTYQRGFASLHTRKSEAGSFTFRINKDAMIETSPRVAYRLYKFLKHHYGK